MPALARLRTTGRLAWLTLQAWLGLVAFDLALRLGFARAHEWVRTRQARTSARATPSAIDDLVWAVDEACVWYVKPVVCLQRSAVLAWLLRRQGVAASLVIGYRAVPFESHAWVEVGERVVNDRQQYRRAFVVLERL
jgi:hypothetical protein